MSSRHHHGLLVLLLLLLVSAPSWAAWTAIAPGLDLGDFPIASPAGEAATATITILRIDPATWSLEFLTPDDTDKATLLTARQWCEQHDLTAAINAGMFAVDFRAHVGFAATQGRVLSEIVNDYQSVAVFDPAPGRALPPFRLFDLDAPGVTLESIRRDYGSVVQNLRLIKRPGENRWPQQDKRWSEVALAEDDQGRIMFVFCRSPLTMHDFNEALLGLGIGIVAAQHLDGGPPAQLYLRAGTVERDLVGSYETGVRQDESNVTAWPIPNVLGIRRR